MTVSELQEKLRGLLEVVKDEEKVENEKEDKEGEVMLAVRN